MVDRAVKCFVVVVLIRYRLFAVLKILQVLVVLESAMTRLITLCPNTQLLPGEDFTQDETQGKKEGLSALELEENSNCGHDIIDTIGQEKGSADEGENRYGEEGSVVENIENYGLKSNRDGDDDGNRYREIKIENTSETLTVGNKDDEILRVEKLGKNEEKEEKEIEEKGESDVILVAKSFLKDIPAIAFDELAEENGKMEEVKLPLNVSGCDVKAKEDGITTLEVDTKDTDHIENLIKELFGDEWGEEDVLRYLSEEEKKENVETNRMNSPLTSSELENDLEIEVNKEDEDDNCSEEAKDYTGGDKCKKIYPVLTSTNSLSLEIDNIDSIDQVDDDGDTNLKGETEKVVNESKNMDEQRLDKIEEKLNKLKEDMASLLDLYPEERSFLEGDKEQKIMPKILQKIHKEEDKQMAWKRAKRFVEDIIEGENDAVDLERNVDNIICSGRTKDAAAVNLDKEPGVKADEIDSFKVGDSKRKLSLSFLSTVEDVQHRKRIASQEVDNVVYETAGTEDSDKDDDFSMIDDDSVFGDDEDSEIDSNKPSQKQTKRVKAESISSTVANILDSLVELGEDETANDSDFMSDERKENEMSQEKQNGSKILVSLVDSETTDPESNLGIKEEECVENKNKSTDSLVKEIKSINVNGDTLGNIKKVTSINRQSVPSLKPGTNIRVDIDSSLEWIKDSPSSLAGPKCSCKTPGTPPWKLTSCETITCGNLTASPARVQTETSYTTRIVSLEHEVVTVKLRRPRCASFSPESSTTLDRNSFSKSESCVIPEDSMSLCAGSVSQDEGKSVKEQKDKRRLLRSLSFFYRNSHNNLVQLNSISSSPSPSETSSLSTSLCNSSAFSTLTTPRRWSRALGKKRRNAQSCVFPDSSFSSVNGKLPSRVRSEPNVTERRSSGSEDEKMPRRLSKVWGEKRRAVKSCIFPDPEDEDLMPYGVTAKRCEESSCLKEEKNNKSRMESTEGVETHISASHMEIQTSQSLLRRLESKDREMESEIKSCNRSISQSDLMTPVLTPRAEVPFSATESKRTSDARGKQSPSFIHRPQSLIIIPESQIGNGLSEVKQPESVLRRPQSLMLPPNIKIPKRDPGLTPPRPKSQSRLSYRDLRILRSSLRRSPSIDENASYPLLSPSPTNVDVDIERTMSLSNRERRKYVRSWSFSPTPASLPFKMTNSPEKWPDIASFGDDHPALRPRKSFGSESSSLLHTSASDTVIFPWRRGDQNRSSGRSSPAPSDSISQSPSPSPYYNQSPVPEESINGSCEVANDSRQKDSVWRRSRGGGGVSRSTRKEKASSSPVFRRASLSHSEWDIRRPWSHVYSEREAAKLSQSVCRLAMPSAEEEGGLVVEGVQDGEEGPRSLPYMPSGSNSSSEGVFQKFKKSLSLRLAKKGSRSESPSSHSAPISHCPPEPTQIESQTLPRRRGSINRDDDNKSSFLFGHPLFRSSKERRRARIKDARSSKCNSGDSGDSGIELVTGSGHVTSLDMTSHVPEVDANNYMDPAFVASLADDGSGLRELNPRAVRRTHSDAGGAAGRASLHYSRQLSTPQPIKLRPAHRLPQHTGSLGKSKSLKRSKASSHLRRSISQPLDLDKAYDTPISTLRKCRSPSVAQNRRHRRPSAGNILNEDNTTSEDEIGMSDSEDFRTDLKRSLEEDEDMIVYAEALWDHVTLDSEELVFKAGDLITVIDSSDKDWWWGRISHRAGWFPAAFVRLLVNQEDHLQSSSNDSRTSGPARKQSISGLSHDQIRTNVINEIISTERDFVKHLRDVVEGYLRQVRKRPDMFNDERVSSIFGNMEALYQFQSNFLKELEMCIDWREPYKSCIGAAFIRNREKFEIYSEYCNNHPSAVSALQELYQDQKYIHFFEACRLLQEMIDISLDGFLLTPVQKICKYPLQLQELLKYTKADHPDYNSVQGALEAMRDVALLVNERKRRMECLEKIASWQITVEGWEGPELLEDSSQLIHQGEVTKGVGGSWPKEMTLFLFDHQLVYCKRDLLKRNTFVYRGRLNLDRSEIVDLPDGKDSSHNINAHNAWKIRSLEKNKWYIFACKTSSEKQKWMEAFRRERELVAADASAGFVVAEKAKQLAKVAARNQRNRPKRPRSLWFSFGGHKKGRGPGRTLTQIQHHPV